MIPFTPVPWIEGPMFTLAVLVFFYYTWIRMKKEKIVADFETYVKLFAVIVGCAYVGGRVWYFFGHLDIMSVFDAVNLFRPGLGSMGMMVGGLVGAVIAFKVYLWRKRGNIQLFARLLDSLTPPLALSLFIIRIGCLFDGHILGNVTNVPWALQYPGEIVGRHPVAGYMALSGFLIFIFLQVYLAHDIRKSPEPGRRPSGQAVGWTLLLYSISSFTIEFMAEGHLGKPDPKYFGLFLVQWIYLAIIIVLVFHSIQHLYGNIFKGEKFKFF